MPGGCCLPGPTSASSVSGRTCHQPGHLSFPFLFLFFWVYSCRYWSWQSKSSEWQRLLRSVMLPLGWTRFWFLKRLTLNAECSAINRVSVSGSESTEEERVEKCGRARGWGVIRRTQQGGCTLELTAGSTASTRPRKPKPDPIPAWGGEVGVKS